MSRGEFTRRFDREVMKDDTVQKEEIAALHAIKSAEDAAVKLEFQKILNILEHRSLWLKQRFETLEEKTGLDFQGRHFSFSQSAESAGDGWLEFRTKLTDTSLGIMLECYMGVEGRFKKRYDYVIFPKEKVSLEKARKFVEAKIFEFAAAWQK